MVTVSRLWPLDSMDHSWKTVLYGLRFCRHPPISNSVPSSRRQTQLHHQNIHQSHSAKTIRFTLPKRRQRARSRIAYSDCLQLGTGRISHVRRRGHLQVLRRLELFRLLLLLLRNFIYNRIRRLCRSTKRKSHRTRPFLYHVMYYVHYGGTLCSRLRS